MTAGKHVPERFEESCVRVGADQPASPEATTRVAQILYAAQPSIDAARQREAQR